MTTVHAFPRTDACEVELHGKTYKFKPNEHGHVVCEVPEDAALNRLLQITDHYREYEAPEAPRAPAKPAAGSDDKYLLKNGEATLDLRPMTDDQLHEFAKANGIQVHHAAKGNTIRDKIVEALKV